MGLALPVWDRQKAIERRGRSSPRVTPCACDYDLDDGEVRALRAVVSGARRGEAMGWTGIVLDYGRHFLSAASRRLAFLSPSGSDTSVRGTHEPPD